MNDNPPIIDKNGINNQVSVKENQTQTETLLTLTASDVDNLGFLTFSLQENQEPFSLNSQGNTTTLMVNQNFLDYEERIFWSVTIIVQVTFQSSAHWGKNQLFIQKLTRI